MSRPRRLHVTVPGRWYLGLTIALGVAAIVSANNGLYLIESLMLAGLILSGVLSERAISGVRCEFSRGRAIEGEPSDDWVYVQNLRSYPIFCVEIGEWRDRRFHRIAYLQALAPRAGVRVPASQVFTKRGRHAWDGFAIATSYPFGFARKLKIISLPGERVVWPGRLTAHGRTNALSHRSIGLRYGTDVVDGEIRAYTPDDDPRMIIWSLSARGTGPMVRVRRSQKQEPESRIDLRREPGEAFELELKRAAKNFHENDSAETSGTLLVISRSGNRRLRGRAHCLDRLALAEAEGKGA